MRSRDGGGEAIIFCEWLCRVIVAIVICYCNIDDNSTIDGPIDDSIRGPENVVIVEDEE